MDYSPIVLKNKGIPITLAQVSRVGTSDDYVREYDDVGEPLTESVNIRFTNNVISEIEEFYGSLEQWQERLEKQPISTLRQTIAFAIRRHVTAVGEGMLEGENMQYSNAIGIAWAIANGVDPTVASKMLKQSSALAEEQKRILKEALQAQQQEIVDSLGDSGTQPGPKRAARSKSSGN